MDITTINYASPGASFTERTNNYILAFYNVAHKYSNKEWLFSEYRTCVTNESGLDMSNARNIFPLLRNYGFIKYEKNSLIKSDEFFTNTGNAYIEVIRSLAKCNETDSESLKIRQQLQNIKKEMLYNGLWKSLQSDETTYKIGLLYILKFLRKFKSIDKTECAYLFLATLNDNKNYLNAIEENIYLYRDNKLDINVKARVKDKSKRGEDVYKYTGIQSFTAFGYLINLICEAGLVVKNKNRYIVIEAAYDKLIDLIKGVENNGN